MSAFSIMSSTSLRVDVNSGVCEISHCATSQHLMAFASRCSCSLIASAVSRFAANSDLIIVSGSRING